MKSFLKICRNKEGTLLLRHPVPLIHFLHPLNQREICIRILDRFTGAPVGNLPLKSADGKEYRDAGRYANGYVR